MQCLADSTLFFFPQDFLAAPHNMQNPSSSAAAAAKSLQSCPTLCDPIDGSPPGSPISGILQARTLEWVAISFSSAGQWKVKVKSLSHVRLLATPWTAAYQAPPSMEFSRQEYCSGMLLNPVIPLLSIYPREIRRYVHTDVHRIISSNQNAEATQMSIKWWID